MLLFSEYPTISSRDLKKKNKGDAARSQTTVADKHIPKELVLKMLCELSKAYNPILLDMLEERNEVAAKWVVKYLAMP